MTRPASFCSNSADGWEPLAFNSVALYVPPGYELDGLDPCYLRLAGPGGASVELRWAFGAAKGGVERAIKRLVKKAGERNFEREAAGTPAVWRTATKQLGGQGREVATYLLQNPSGPRTLGAVCTDPAADIALLLGWTSGSGGAGVSGGGDEACLLEQAEQFLARLALQPMAGWRDFTLFGIQALVPGGYRLAKHAFRPGEYLLAFARGAESLVLGRRTPASLVRKGASLEALARRFAEPAVPERTEPELAFVPEGVCLSYAVSSGGLLARLLGKTTPARIQLWSPEYSNALLSVGGMGGWVERETFATVVREFQLV